MLVAAAAVAALAAAAGECLVEVGAEVTGKKRLGEIGQTGKDGSKNLNILLRINNICTINK